MRLEERFDLKGEGSRCRSDTQSKHCHPEQTILERLLQLLAVQVNTHQVPTAAAFGETAPSDVCGENSVVFKKGKSGPSVFHAIFIA